jgi:hypothetical protein
MTSPAPGRGGGGGGGGGHGLPQSDPLSSWIQERARHQAHTHRDARSADHISTHTTRPALCNRDARTADQINSITYCTVHSTGTVCNSLLHHTYIRCSKFLYICTVEVGVCVSLARLLSVSQSSGGDRD